MLIVIIYLFNISCVFILLLIIPFYFISLLIKNYIQISSTLYKFRNHHDLLASISIMKKQ